MARWLAAALVLVQVLAATADEALVVIVHPTCEASLSRDDVARIFLLRQRFWKDGSPIVPLNLPPGSPLRERFSRSVLGTDAAKLVEYWNRQYFQGVFPPAVLSSPDAVKRYVAGDRKAVGYVGASQVDDSVRVVLRLE